MWNFFFDWYQGSVWGNILANVLWAVPLYFYSRYHFKRLHKKHDDMHSDIKQLKEMQK